MGSPIVCRCESAITGVPICTTQKILKPFRQSRLVGSDPINLAKTGYSGGRKRQIYRVYSSEPSRKARRLPALCRADEKLTAKPENSLVVGHEQQDVAGIEREAVPGS